jgi:hypothetical protein
MVSDKRLCGAERWKLNLEKSRGLPGGGSIFMETWREGKELSWEEGGGWFKQTTRPGHRYFGERGAML